MRSLVATMSTFFLLAQPATSESTPEWDGVYGKLDSGEYIEMEKISTIGRGIFMLPSAPCNPGTYCPDPFTPRGRGIPIVAEWELERSKPVEASALESVFVRSRSDRLVRVTKLVRLDLLMSELQKSGLVDGWRVELDSGDEAYFNMYFGVGLCGWSASDLRSRSMSDAEYEYQLSDGMKLMSEFASTASELPMTYAPQECVSSSSSDGVAGLAFEMKSGAVYYLLISD